MDADGAREQAEAAIAARTKQATRWGSVAGILVLLGVIFVVGAPAWEVLQAVVFVLGFGIGSVVVFGMAPLVGGRRLLDEPLGRGRLEVVGSLRQGRVWLPGAAEGAGLGALFLRHVQRTRLLLHLVDIAPMEGGVDADPVEQVRAIENELRRYDPAMLEKPRWLVLNKADLMFEDEAREKAKEIVAGLGWDQPWFLASAIGREGTWPIMLEVQAFFDRLRAEAREAGGAGDDAG